MGAFLSWPALLSLLAGVGTLSLAYYVRSFRDQPGARFWAGVLVTAALWAFSYGTALLVFDPGLRPLFEVPLWFAKAFAPLFILLFALEYTGRGEVVRSRLVTALIAVYGIEFLLYATNPVHGLLWSDYRIDPVFGAATVRYEFEPLLLVFVGVSYVLIAVGLLALVDAVVSYGSLYRRHSVALVLAIGLSSAANAAWLFRLGPAPQLDLTPITFLFTGLLATYALFQNRMFELLPATRRIADRVAIDDLDVAIVIVSLDGRVLRLNRSAAELFDCDSESALTRPLDELLPTTIPLTETTGTVSDLTGRGTEHKVTVSPVGNPDGEHVGYTVAFQDITAERLRQQRLEVLNRVLRHNVRNELNVIQGSAELIEVGVDGDELADEVTPIVRTIVRKSEALERTARKARDIEQLFSASELERWDLELAPLVETVVESVRERYPEADFTVSIPENVTVCSNDSVLELVLGEAVENAVAHARTERPAVAVRVRPALGDDSVTVLEIEDDGPGIPEQELSVLRDGSETQLKHSTGLGLWIIAWGSRMLQVDLEFDVTDAGTSVLVRLPTDESDDETRT